METHPSRSKKGFVHYKRDPNQLSMGFPAIDLKCVKCERSFDSPADLGRHYKSAHKVLEPLQIQIRRLTD